MTNPSLPDGPPGLSLSRLTGWFDKELPGLRAGELSAEAIAGGRSNLTYRLTDGDTVVRCAARRWATCCRPRTTWRASSGSSSALRGGGSRCPAASLLCADREVIGAPFYVMEYVDGVVLRRADASTAARRRPPPGAAARRWSTCWSRLHAVDPAAVGLADFGRPEGFLERQVSRWHQQWQRSQTRELPLSTQVHRRLAARVPDSPAAGIVHGDYRLDNVMFAPDLSRDRRGPGLGDGHIGDPLADVGLLVVYTDLARRTRLCPTPVPRRLPQRRRAGRAVRAPRAALQLDELDWYMALGYYKLAMISEGIHARYLQGKTVGEGFEGFGRLCRSSSTGWPPRCASRDSGKEHRPMDFAFSDRGLELQARGRGVPARVRLPGRAATSTRRPRTTRDRWHSAAGRCSAT